jgi:hypothetical protein
MVWGVSWGVAQGACESTENGANGRHYVAMFGQMIWRWRRAVKAMRRAGNEVDRGGDSNNVHVVDHCCPAYTYLPPTIARSKLAGER